MAGRVERVGSGEGEGRVERAERVGCEEDEGRVERAERVGSGESAERVEEMRELASQVGQIAYGVHKYFGNGLLEKVYENALAHRLSIAGYKVERQKPLMVFDVDGFCVGSYFADLLINDCLIVELKAVNALAPEHYVQILNYLHITRNPIGLLINFGSYKFERRTIVA